MAAPQKKSKNINVKNYGSTKKRNFSKKISLKPEVQKTSDKKLLLILEIVLLLIVFMVFSPVLKNGFLNYDDNKFITENTLVTQLNGQHFIQFFQTALFTPFYKPLVYLSWAVEYHFFQYNSSVFHLDNLILHMVNVSIVLFFLIFILNRQYPKHNTRSKLWIAFIIAVLYGIHPLKVESVAWAIERKDMLLGFFFFSSLYCYLFYVDKKKYIFILVGSLLFFLGILSKSMIIMLPFSLFVVDYLFKRKFDRNIILEKIPYFLFFIVGLFLYGAFNAFHNLILDITGFGNHEPIHVNQLAHSNPFLVEVVATSYRILFFLFKIILPIYHSPIYKLPDFYYSHELNFYCYLFPLIVIIITGFGIYLHKFTRSVPAGLLFFFINIIPILAFHGSETSFIADRYDYISSIGITCLWGVLLIKIFKS